MAKKSVQARNEKRRIMIEHYAPLRKKFKKEGNYQALDQLPKNSSPGRYRNRCSNCSRGRGYMRDFGLCRICFRQKASEGQLPGIKKASW